MSGLAKPYSTGPYNKAKDGEQWLRITEGCPHSCPFCYEPQEKKVFPIPDIVAPFVKIMDMNLLCKPQALAIIRVLGKQRLKGKRIKYELICGIDYRFLTQEIANALHDNGFINIRLAWDWFYSDNIKIRKAIKMLTSAGYRPISLMVFMISNWRISYDECEKKLDMLKVWGVKVADCWFDNQYGRIKRPVYWTQNEIDRFRRRCRKHNQIVSRGYDPEPQFNDNKLLLLAANPASGK